MSCTPRQLQLFWTERRPSESTGPPTASPTPTANHLPDDTPPLPLRSARINREFLHQHGSRSVSRFGTTVRVLQPRKRHPFLDRSEAIPNRVVPGSCPVSSQLWPLSQLQAGELQILDSCATISGMAGGKGAMSYPGGYAKRSLGKQGQPGRAVPAPGVTLTEVRQENPHSEGEQGLTLFAGLSTAAAAVLRPPSRPNQDINTGRPAPTSRAVMPVFISTGVEETIHTHGQPRRCSQALEKTSTGHEEERIRWFEIPVQHVHPLSKP
ncbi:hypothetical protein B0T21DRAFT_344237 [Apiosordaria backusii]|uniref:Uncharacterized protein n=1 Tax=Apiosordaria backusii TaxID=314023 RepID=A0AA40F081_9PEZI|nr:hypothetical protein B0T21DRAFT_344237 [Apiosordaria backusii]